MASSLKSYNAAATVTPSHRRLYAADTAPIHTNFYLYDRGFAALWGSFCRTVTDRVFYFGMPSLGVGEDPRLCSGQPVFGGRTARVAGEYGLAIASGVCGGPS